MAFIHDRVKLVIYKDYTEICGQQNIKFCNQHSSAIHLYPHLY